jgi:hypothetical protein
MVRGARNMPITADFPYVKVTISPYAGANPQQLVELALTLLPRAPGFDCPICLTDSPGPIFRLGCSHTFHYECLGPWAARHASCPCCRARIAASDANTLVQAPSVPRMARSSALEVSTDPTASAEDGPAPSDLPDSCCLLCLFTLLGSLGGLAVRGVCCAATVAAWQGAAIGAASGIIGCLCAMARPALAATWPPR